MLKLNKEQQHQLLELCIHYFPETKMKIREFSDGYKGHEVKFKIESNGAGSGIKNEIPKSPNVLMGLHQIQDAGGYGYEQYVEIHWYELCMCELANRMYNEDYIQKMYKLFESHKHVVDFLYEDYSEDYDLNIIS